MPVSVILPAYNAARYVEQAARSVLDQTHGDLELIVVDDGSTDDTPAIADRLAEGDRRISVVHQRNAGTGAACNAGLDRATGDFVTWQAADDRSAPNRLSMMLEALSGGADYAHCDMLLIDDDDVPFAYWQGRAMRPDDVLPHYLTAGTPFNFPTLVIRRALFDASRFPDLVIGEDTAVAAEVLPGRPGAYVAEPLYLYRRHAAQATAPGANTYAFAEVGLLLERRLPVDLVPEARWPGGTPAEEEVVARTIAGFKLARRGDGPHAHQELSALTARTAELRPGVARLGRALVKLAMHCPEDALALLAQADGPAAVLANYRGEALAMAGRRTEAVDEYFRALQLSPSYAEPMANLRSLGGPGFRPIDPSLERDGGRGAGTVGATTGTPAPRGSRPEPLDLPDAPSAVDAAKAAWLRRSADACGRPWPALRRSAPPADRLRVVYLMPRTDPCGGARIILEHVSRLTRRGDDVVALSYSPPPSWFGQDVPFVHVPLGQPLDQAIPPCDVVVAGYWEQVAAARRQGIAPVVHLEQGDAHLYDAIAGPTQKMVAERLGAASLTIAVGPAARDALAGRYGVGAELVPNGIDLDLFHPDEDRTLPERSAPHVLFVGWDGNEFKGVDVLRRVAAGLAQSHPAARVVWVTPRPPVGPPVGEVVVAPSQAALARIYRQATVYVGASRYETFPLPPLEAMASGAAVVSTANPGIGAYAVHGENALLAPVDDHAGLLAHVRRVLDDPDMAGHLRAAGLATAARFTWPEVIDRLHDRYRQLAASVPCQPSPAAIGLDGLVFEHPGDEERLARLAAVCPTRHAAVPVSRPVVDDLRLVRWEEVVTCT
ncbi:MAG: glycosyltransferase, partial [Acidimicrobiales bacterium]